MSSPRTIRQNVQRDLYAFDLRAFEGDPANQARLVDTATPDTDMGAPEVSSRLEVLAFDRVEVFLDLTKGGTQTGVTVAAQASMDGNTWYNVLREDPASLGDFIPDVRAIALAGNTQAVLTYATTGRWMRWALTPTTSATGSRAILRASRLLWGRI